MMARILARNESLAKLVMRWSVRNQSTSGRVDDGLVQIDDNFENKFIRKLTMINEKQRNSLGIDMIRSLQKGIDTIDREKCRVVVIASSSNKVFSSGHNLKEFTRDHGTKNHETVFAEFTRLCLSLQRLPVPTIAQVSGLAAAAGFQLAASCDLLIASAGASFSTPGVKFGVFCTTPGVPLSRQASPKISLKMLFTGEPVKARDAYQCGIVSEVVDSDGDLDRRVLEIARLIEANPKGVIALGKKSFYEQIKHADLGDAYQLAANAMVENLKYEDTQNGLKAFAAKTKPKWIHSSNKIDTN